MAKRVAPSKRKVIVKPTKWIGKHPSSGKDRNKILIDKDLPKSFRKGVALHERKEAEYMEGSKNKYTTAHRKANKDEIDKFGKKYYKKEQHAVLSDYDKKLAKNRKRKSK